MNESVHTETPKTLYPSEHDEAVCQDQWSAVTPWWARWWPGGYPGWPWVVQGWVGCQGTMVGGYCI